MTLLVCVLTDMVYIMTMLMMCNMIFKFQERKNFNKKIQMLVIMLFVIALSIGIHVWDSVLIETFVYIVFVCMTLIYLFQERFVTILVSSIWIVVVMSMLDTMSIVLFEIICKIIGCKNSEFSKLLASFILCIAIFCLGKVYAKKYNRGIRTIGIFGISFFTILTIVDTFIVMVLARITISESEREVKDVLFIVFILVILGLFLQLGAVILILMQRNIYKESQQLTAMYLDDQTKHYEYLENRETETKKFRHDLRDHMDMLVSFAREHKYDEFDDYVEKIHTKVDKLGNAVSVQNSVVDAILNRYYSEAIKNDVKMEVEGKFPVDCKIENYDICTIFSNLLRNALEATMKAEEKWISVGCRYTDKVIVVEIANSFDNKAGNGKSKTHKVDKNNHGFGLINVEESIEKYNGVWYREQEDNVYKVTISFIYARMEEKDEDSNN